MFFPKQLKLKVLKFEFIFLSFFLLSSELKAIEIRIDDDSSSFEGSTQGVIEDVGLVGLVKEPDDIGPDEGDIKFGILVENDDYHIYRSSKLGDSELEALSGYLEERNLPFPKTIIYMNSWGYKFPFYFGLNEYLLQEKYGYQYYHSFGTPRTYLDGYNPYEPSEDIDSKSILGRHARKHFDLRDDGVDGGIDSFFTILNLILDPKNQPVLFHCFGGRHRTGMIAMAVRYLQGGWWVHGPRFERNGMALNPAQFEYYRFNHLFFRKENIEFIEKVSQDPRFLDLVDKYRSKLVSESSVID